MSPLYHQLLQLTITDPTLANDDKLGWIALGAILLALAGSALLLRRSQSRRLKCHIAELSALSEASRAIVESQLDVDQLCGLIYRQASQIVDTRTFQLGLFAGESYHIKVWIKRGEHQPEAAFDLDGGEGIVGWMRETGQSLLVRDFEIDTLPAQPSYLSSNPPRSAVFVSLVTGETVIGAMAIQSDRPAAFTTDHQRTLSIIANQAAAAISNARLYESEQRRRRMADTLRQISVEINASLQVDNILESILEGLTRLIHYDAAAILLLNENRTFTLRAARGQPALSEALGQSWPLTAGQRLRWLVKHRQATLFDADQASGAYHQLLNFPDAHSCLGAPILIRDELIGVLMVEAAAPEQYDAQDVKTVDALTTQAAPALENARLYAAGQEEAWISTALLEVTEATGLAKSVDEVLETVVRITPMLVGVDGCYILLWESEIGACHVAAAYQEDENKASLSVGQLIPPGTWSLLDRLWESGSPIVDEFGSLPDAPSTQDIETTLLMLPLRAQGELIGAMVIDFVGQVSFTQHRIKLIAGIANQAAQAIESAQLAAAQQEEAWVSMALLQVAEAVGTLSELDDVLAMVARLTPLLVGVDRCLIYLWEKTHQAYVPGAAFGLYGERMDVFQTTSIPADQWPAIQIEAPQPHAGPRHQDRLSPEAQDARGQVPLVAGPPQPIADVLGLQAPLALPLLAWGDIMGALVVDTQSNSAPLADRRRNILSGVAQQTATAIQNAQLHIESIERQKLEREIELARQIQVSFLPAQAPQMPGWDLAAYWRGARQVSGDFYDFIPLNEREGQPQRWGFVVADVADKGVPAALFMALSRTLVRTMAIGGDPPAEVLRRANDLILADARSDLFVTLFYAILNMERGTLTYANGGHNPPLVFDGRTDRVTPLAVPGMALGIVSGIQLEEREIALGPGDTVLFYTDGVTDALNAEVDEFGLKRLRRVVQAHQSQSAAAIVQAVNQAVAEFVGDTPQFDDFTLLVLKRQP